MCRPRSHCSGFAAPSLRYLVISDLHSNLEGLEAVLEDSKGQYSRIICCGDLAGYGPNPNEVIDWDERALVDAIRRQARHEETTRWDTIEFKLD